MLSLQEIARALGGEIAGGSVRAPGPGHSAADRSMCVTPSATAPEGFVVNSFADDDWKICKDHVCNRLGLDSWKPNGARNKAEKASKPKRTAIKTTVYEFRDPSTGEPRYHKKRLDFADGTKDFYFCEKPSRNGGPRLLYRGELLAEAVRDGASVFVVEGERKVDALMELGAFAVSADTGGKAKWTTENARLLCDLPVILWPDSDEVGERYIANAAAAIRAENPLADIRVIRPFPRASGGEKGLDVCDWTGSEAALKALVESAEPYEAPAEFAGNGHDGGGDPALEEPDNLPPPIGEPMAGNGHDGEGLDKLRGVIFDGDAPPAKAAMLIDRLLPKEGLTFLGGQSGSGKTFVAVDCAVSLATAASFFGYETMERVGVIYLAAEGAATIEGRIAAAKKARGVEGNLPIAIIKSIPDLANANARKAFIEKIRAVAREIKRRWGVRVGCVMLDTVAGAFSMKSENDAAEISRVCKAAQELGASIDAATLALAHYGKAQETGIRGSSAYRGGGESVMAVLADRDELTGKCANRRLIHPKSRISVEGPIAAFELKHVDIGVDEAGLPFGSAFIEVGQLLDDIDSAAVPDKERRLSPSGRIFIEALHDALDDDGEMRRPYPDMSQVKAVGDDRVRKVFDPKYPAHGETEKKRTEARRKAFTRGFMEALDRRLVATREVGGIQLVWLTKKEKYQ